MFCGGTFINSVSNYISGLHVIGKGSWKKQEVGNFQVGKLEVRKFPLRLESTNRSWKVFNAVLSNQKFSNFGSSFPTSFFPISFRTSKLLVFSNPFPTTSRKYTRFKILNMCHKNNLSSHR